MVKSLVNSTDSSQYVFNDIEVKKLGNKLRAWKSRYISKGLTEEEAVREACKAIPTGFPKESLPEAFKIHYQARTQVSDTEVKQLVSDMIESGKFIQLQRNDSATRAVENSTAQHSATTENKAVQRSATLVNCEAQQPQQYDIVIGACYVFQLVLYAVLVPTTAEVVKSALAGLNAPLPLDIISWAIALAIDFVALLALNQAQKLKGKDKQHVIAIAAVVFAANIAGLLYKTYLDTKLHNDAKIVEIERNAEAARLHWLNSKWRNAPNPTACEDGSNVEGCGTPYTKAARTRQDKYLLELAKLDRLEEIEIPKLHIAYFIFLWLLAGSLTLLTKQRKEAIG